MFEIYAYGNVDTLTGVFNAIAAIMGGADYFGLIKTVAITGVLVAAFAGLFTPGRFAGWGWFIGFMLVYNTAAEATRLASRLASMCDPSAAQQSRIRQRVRYFVEASGQLSVGERSDWLVLSYLPANCSASSCLWAEARLSDVQAKLVIPVSAITLALPPYRSVQMRESMRNVIAGENNSHCD